MGKIIEQMINENLVFGLSNRMTGKLIKQFIDGKEIFVAQSLNILTWDVVSNPAESETLIEAVPIDKNNFKFESINRQKTEGDEKMDFSKDERNEAQRELKNSVEKLNYDYSTKQNILDGGKYINDKALVDEYLRAQRKIIDSAVINSKLENLGIKDKNEKGVKIISEINEAKPWKPIVDNIMKAFDNDNIKNNRYTSFDSKMRNANLKIFDNMFEQMKNSKSTKHVYNEFMRGLLDSAQAFNSTGNLGIVNGITDSEFSGTSQYGNTAVVSLAVLQQIFQDLKFLQLVMVESFGGKNYKVPVEFRSSDVYSQDVFGGIGEFDGVPSEGIESYLMEFSSQWLKRSFIISKEAEVEQMKGPFAYDVVARNTASLTERFQRIIDQIISNEMISVSDEYLCQRVENEKPDTNDVITLNIGTDVPISSNAEKMVKLLCGKSSPRNDAKGTPNIVRPRKNTFLNSKGRTEEEFSNEIEVKNGSDLLIRGYWDSVNGKIKPIMPNSSADYAVDFENGNIYFAKDAYSSNISVSYSYATNISYFDTAVSSSLMNFPARYYNLLIEMIDDIAANMGSAPRFSRPDFLIGSLRAMSYYRKAELFYNKALPYGTSMMKGDMWFARRSQIDIGEHNAPWAAGDQRILIGAKNRTRLGIGSPLALEGPFPYIDKLSGKYTTAKEWVASLQYVVGTPLVIDEFGNQYNPPFRTIKFY